MRRSVILPLLFAIIAAGATYLALNRPTGTGGASAPQTDKVAVAAHPIDAGASFGASDVTFNDVPRGSAPGDAVRDTAQLQNAFASAAIPKGAIVRQSNLSSTPIGSHLSTLIPNGFVAVSIAVNDVISTGGFVVPGDHVDVLGVTSKDATDSASIVLRDVPVLAVSNSVLGQTANSADSKKSTSGAATSPTSLDSTVTLAVTIQDAQRLVQVDEVGKLRLALRRPATNASLSSGVPQTTN